MVLLLTKLVCQLFYFQVYGNLTEENRMYEKLRGITRLDGVLGKTQVGTLMFESEPFRKQMSFIAESACDIVGIFWRPP